MTCRQRNGRSLGFGHQLNRATESPFPMAINPKKLKFIRSMSVNSPFYLLMEHLPGVSFFAKNLDHEIVCANSSFLERLGVKTEDEIIGQTDDELFPKSLAEHFRADDEWVIANKKPKLHIKNCLDSERQAISSSGF